MNEPAIDYIPHSGSMALIDKIIDVGEDFIECSVRLDDSHLFSDSEGRIPAWISIEYMAQTIGAYAGWNDSKKGLPVKVGFLLGSRKLTLHRNYFDEPVLLVRAELVFRDEELGSFKCSIMSNDRDRILAEATVNVYQPHNIFEFVEENK